MLTVDQGFSVTGIAQMHSFSCFEKLMILSSVLGSVFHLLL